MCAYQIACVFIIHVRAHIYVCMYVCVYVCECVLSSTSLVMLSLSLQKSSLFLRSHARLDTVVSLVTTQRKRAQNKNKTRQNIENRACMCL
jgi:hypothetical protein